jgi:O-antigen chain-terminating methyltransferase
MRADTLLGPHSDPEFVRLAYRCLLAREVDPAAFDAAVTDLKAGVLTRTSFLSGIVASDEFQEMTLVDEGVRLVLSGGVVAAEPFGAGRSERVVEVPWVIGRYRGEKRALDIGYANAPPAYLRALLRLAVPDLHVVDVAMAELPDALRTCADVRALPYASASFDLVVCISTLEHIGRDNRRYGVEVDDSGADDVAIAEMARVLRPGGRLLVTVPYGAAEDHGWFVQYDRVQWETLIATAPLDVAAHDLFRLAPEGWVAGADEDAVASCHYGRDVPAANSILCAELVRRS